MRRVALLATTAFVLIAAAPQAHLLINDRDFSPAVLLPPPPADTAAELEQLHRIDATRSDAELVQARSDNDVKDVMIFASVLGPRFDIEKLPATKQLFATVRREEKHQADRAKAFFQRNRPWTVDGSLHSCSTDDEPKSSYPSGHTTMGFAMGAVLARLVPAHAQQILARSAGYGRSRMICEMHFASDVAAGQTLGMLIAQRLLDTPAFQTQYDDAAAELKAAGIS